MKTQKLIIIGTLAITALAFQNCAKTDFRAEAGIPNLNLSASIPDEIIHDGPAPSDQPPQAHLPAPQDPLTQNPAEIPDEDGSAGFYARCRAAGEPVAMLDQPVDTNASDIELRSDYGLQRKTIESAKNVRVHPVVRGNIDIKRSDSFLLNGMGGSLSVVTRALESVNHMVGALKVNAVELGPISDVAGLVFASTDKMKGDLHKLVVGSCIHTREIDSKVQIHNSGGFLMLSSTASVKPVLPKINHYVGVLILENVDVEEIENGVGAVVLINSRVHHIKNFMAKVYMRNSTIDSEQGSKLARREF